MASNPSTLPLPDELADARWQDVMTRNPQADGQFVYAVRTTGIYCRASCPSACPNRKCAVFCQWAGCKSSRLSRLPALHAG
jgi:AraC family transcriptional regulator of adaptative response/methylated-DNA-[protein]-cysteine methyltransferase